MYQAAESFNTSAWIDVEEFDPDALIVPAVEGIAPAATVGEYKAWFAAEAAHKQAG